MSKSIMMEETTPKGCTLLEDTSVKQPKKGCLGTMYGPCADYKNPTRNNNFYSRKLWENAFNDPLIKESLQDRILLGELDHPVDGRLETHASNACIVMTDYSFDDNQQVVMGRFDILDTPQGRILKSLLDYGCKIGVSSRGEGDVTSKNGMDVVDPDTFTFVGFDAVVLPAVKRAKPALQESVHRKSLTESISKEINNIKTLEDLNTVKSVIEKINLPESDSLLESIDIKSKELNRTTGSNLLEDLETANVTILELNQEIRSLKEQVTTSRTRVGQLTESRNSLMKSTEAKDKKYRVIKEKYNTLLEAYHTNKNELSKLNESISQLGKEKADVESRLRTACSENKNLKDKVTALKTSLVESQSATQSKVKELKKAKDQVIEMSGNCDVKVNLLEEQLTKTKNEATIKLEEADKKIKDLEAKLQESIKINNKLVSDYAIDKARACGLNPKLVLESLSNGSSIKDVDRLVESVRDRYDRYSTLPIANGTLLSGKVSMTQNSHSELSEDLERSKQFMEGFYSHR